MYRAFLAAHSINRWLVLIALALAIGRALRGWLGGREWTSADETTGKALAGLMDLQMLLGLVLYVFLSPHTREGFSDLGAALGDRVLQFWTLEHGPVMLIALVLTHIGASRSRRPEEARDRHRTAALWFGIAALLVLAAIPWPFLSYGRGLFPSL